MTPFVNSEKGATKEQLDHGEMAIAINVPLGRRGLHGIGRCPMCRGSRRMSILRVSIVSFKDMNFLS